MQKNKMKIVGFDSWTQGGYHFARLLPALNERGMSLVLIHLGSWGNDPGRPSQERIGNLEVRDISFYGNVSFERVLDVEQPDAVIFLSTQTFAHRAFLRYCQQRSIPTLHLYHGIVNVWLTDDQRGSYKVNRLAYTKFVYSKMGKLFTHTFPCYIGALLKTKAQFNDWVRFTSDVIRMAVGKFNPVEAPDAKTTKCAVYVNADIEHAVQTYGFDSDDVFAVGNPDLIDFGLLQSQIGYRGQQFAPVFKSIMYINTALSAVGVMFPSPQAFIDHLIHTSQALAMRGISMSFKPHPALDWHFLQQSLDGSNVELVSKANFLVKLQECAACIVETTSLALVPALMGMPLLYANYNELKELRFGPVLMSYPRGYLLRNVADVLDILGKDAQEFDQKALNDWIALNAGPLPAEAMSHRVAEIVERMIRERQTGEKVS